MITYRSILTLVLAASALAIATAGCAVEPGEEAPGESADEVVGTNKCMLPGGTDKPGAKAPRCAVVAPLGARIRASASLTAREVQPEGWGGMPCGWELSLQDTSIGSSVSSCNLWGEFSGTAAGKPLHGFAHSSLVECQMADESAGEFDARVGRACKGTFASAAVPAAPTYSPSSCAPDAAWRKVASHNGVPMTQGMGRDAAAVSTQPGKSAHIAAIFRAYAGSTYLGCFKTSGSRTYGGAAAVQGTYSVASTSPFHVINGGVTTWATSATVDYFVTAGDATVR